MCTQKEQMNNHTQTMRNSQYPLLVTTKTKIYHHCQSFYVSNKKKKRRRQRQRIDEEGQRQTHSERNE